MKLVLELKCEQEVESCFECPFCEGSEDTGGLFCDLMGENRKALDNPFDVVDDGCPFLKGYEDDTVKLLRKEED